MKQIRPSLTPVLHEWLITYARLTNRSCSAVVRMAVTEYRDHHLKEFVRLQARSEPKEIEEEE